MSLLGMSYCDSVGRVWPSGLAVVTAVGTAGLLLQMFGFGGKLGQGFQIPNS